MENEFENLGNNDLFLEKSEEINIKEQSLTDAQRIEIRRRYDLSVAIGMKAHKIKEQIDEIETCVKSNARFFGKIEILLWFFSCVFIIVKFGPNGLANEFLTKYEWFFIAPSFAFWFYIFSPKKYDKDIDNLNSKFIDLEVQWDSCNAYYSLAEYIQKRQANNIFASERGDFTLVAIGLRKCIINRVDFKYTWS